MKIFSNDVKAKEIDHKKTGELARADRERAGLSLRMVAKRMGFTPPYISDLELGRRNWSTELVEAFNAAIKKGA